jgi:hypothetical protein
MGFDDASAIPILILGRYNALRLQNAAFLISEG